MISLLVSMVLAAQGSYPADKLDLSGVLHVYHATRYDGACWSTPITVIEGQDHALLVIKKCDGWKYAVVLVE